MMAFFTGLAVACVVAVGTIFLYQTASISAVEYRADWATHVNQETVNSEMGEQTRKMLRRGEERSAQ